MTGHLPDTIEGVDKSLGYYAAMRARYTPGIPREVREHDAARVDELLEWRLMLVAAADLEAGESA